MKKCDEINCDKEATEKMRGINLCQDHYTSLVYDMVGLVLKKDKSNDPRTN